MKTTLALSLAIILTNSLAATPAAPKADHDIDNDKVYATPLDAARQSEAAAPTTAPEAWSAKHEEPAPAEILPNAVTTTTDTPAAAATETPPPAAVIPPPAVTVARPDRPSANRTSIIRTGGAHTATFAQPDAPAAVQPPAVPLLPSLPVEAVSHVTQLAPPDWSFTNTPIEAVVRQLGAYLDRPLMVSIDREIHVTGVWEKKTAAAVLQDIAAKHGLNLRQSEVAIVVDDNSRALPVASATVKTARPEIATPVNREPKRIVSDAEYLKSVNRNAVARRKLLEERMLISAEAP